MPNQVFERPEALPGWMPLPELDENPNPVKLIFESLIDLLGGATGTAPVDTPASRIGELGPAALGMGVARRFGGAGKRIAAKQQSFSEGKFKVPRFRSELGTFIKHEGEWWRLKPFGATDDIATIELLDDVDGDYVPILKKSIPMKDLVENAQKYNAANNPSKGKVARRRK